MRAPASHSGSSRSHRRLCLLGPDRETDWRLQAVLEAIFRGMALVIPGRSDAIAASNGKMSLRPSCRCLAGYFCVGTACSSWGQDSLRSPTQTPRLPFFSGLLLASEQTAGRTRLLPCGYRLRNSPRRFAVSRPQVVRVLDEAVEAGLVERSGPDGLQITVLPRLRKRDRGLLCQRIPALRPLHCRVALDQVDRGDYSN